MSIASQRIFEMDMKLFSCKNVSCKQIIVYLAKMGGYYIDERQWHSSADTSTWETWDKMFMPLHSILKPPSHLDVWHQRVPKRVVKFSHTLDTFGRRLVNVLRTLYTFSTRPDTLTHARPPKKFWTCTKLFFGRQRVGWHVRGTF